MAGSTMVLCHLQHTLPDATVQLYTHRFLYEEQPDTTGAAKRHVETTEHTAYPARPDSVLSALQSPTGAASSSANGPLRRAGGSSSSAYVEVELAGMTNGVAGTGKLGGSREAAVQIEVAADELERQALIRETTIKVCTMTRTNAMTTARCNHNSAMATVRLDVNGLD